MFDAAHFFQKSEVENGAQGFPARVHVPAFEEMSERVLEVSEGGVIKTPYLHDAFLLAHDGITGVIQERELSAEFYAAADAAITGDVYFPGILKEVFETRQQYTGSADTKRERSLENRLFKSAVHKITQREQMSDPVFTQAIEDAYDLWPFLYDWEHFLKHKGDDEQNIERWYQSIYCQMNQEQSAYFFHVDHNRYARVLSSYIGQATQYIDVRLNHEFIEAAIDNSFEDRSFNDVVEREGFPIRSSKVGNRMFIKGTTGFVDTHENAIRNLLVHSSPPQTDDNRFTVAWG